MKFQSLTFNAIIQNSIYYVSALILVAAVAWCGAAVKEWDAAAESLAEAAGIASAPFYLFRCGRSVFISQLNFTTSKSLPVTRSSSRSSSLFQRGSGAPLINILLPISASIKPYFFMAVNMIWLCGEKELIS